VLPGDGLGASFGVVSGLGGRATTTWKSLITAGVRLVELGRGWRQARVPSTRAQNASPLPCLAEGGRLAVILSDLLHADEHDAAQEGRSGCLLRAVYAAARICAKAS